MNTGLPWDRPSVQPRPTAVMRSATGDASMIAEYKYAWVPVTVPAGLTVAQGDLVVLDRVNGTFRVSQVIGHGY